jgi:hypothetical protein
VNPHAKLLFAHLFKNSKQSFFPKFEVCGSVWKCDPGFFHVITTITNHRPPFVQCLFRDRFAEKRRDLVEMKNPSHRLLNPEIDEQRHFITLLISYVLALTSIGHIHH